MPLTQTQIQYIDNYLIKNGVNYWDVRLELLDHIVLAVEAKMQSDNLGFIEALAEVHHNFGNALKPPRYQDDYYLEKTLYQGNNGFQKFTQNKQQELTKRYSKLYRKTLGSFLMSKGFLLEYALVLLVVLMCYKYSPKLAAILALVICFIPEVMKISQTFLKKRNRTALQLQAAYIGSSLWMSLSGLFFMVFNNVTKDLSPKPYYIICVVFVALFPFLRHGLNVLMGIKEKTASTYKLLQ